MTTMTYIEVRYLDLNEMGSRAVIIGKSIREVVENLASQFTFLEVRPFEYTVGHGHLSVLTTIMSDDSLDNLVAAIHLQVMTIMQEATFEDEIVEHIITKQRANISRAGGQRKRI